MQSLAAKGIATNSNSRGRLCIKAPRLQTSKIKVT